TENPTRDIVPSTPRNRRQKQEKSPVASPLSACRSSASVRLSSSATHLPPEVAGFPFPETVPPQDLESMIKLCRALALWKDSYNVYLERLKDHAEDLGLYD